MINYAVVGAGWISQIAFLPGVHQSGNSSVAAIVSGDPAKANELAAFHGVETVVGYDGYDALLASTSIDAVYVALPNHMHAHYAIRAARAGKHILVEKPLAANEAEALDMIAAAREANVFLTTAYRLHNEPGTVAVLDHIRAGAIGRPLFFQSAFSFQTVVGNHRLIAATWGGPLQDVGVYCVNAAHHVFGEEPVEAMATAQRPAGDPRFGEVDASVAAMLRFPSGGVAQFVVSFGGAPVDNYRVVGTLGDLIAAGNPPEADGDEGLADMRALLAIEKACHTGRAELIASPPRPRHPTADMVRLAAPTDRRLVF
jgi:predicted dehydrogenase